MEVGTAGFGVEQPTRRSTRQSAYSRDYGNTNCPTRATRGRYAPPKNARKFLLIHRLYRSHRTGAVIKPEFKRFAFPPRWHYDILRALDYFQSVTAPRDPRLADAIDIVRTSKNSEGYWPLANKFNGKTHFELERLGKESRWNTLRALRVLKWWEGKAQSYLNLPDRDLSDWREVKKELEARRGKVVF
jgi:hypothetical protein